MTIIAGGPQCPHSIQIIPLVWVIATKPYHETVVTRLNVSHLIRQILPFYGNSNFDFFFNFRKKSKMDFKNCFFVFFYFYSIFSYFAFPPLFPAFPPPFPAFPPHSLHSHPDSPHSHLDSPHSPQSQYSLSHSLHSHHSPHSVPRILIPAFNR